MCSWVSFILLLALCFSFNGVSGARHRKAHHSAAVLTGTVYCDTCFRQEVPKSTHFISGAMVAVECGGDGVKPKFREVVKTDEKGEFEAKLPVYVGKNVNKIKGCSVRLISSSEPYCAVAATATSSDIRFKSKKAGTHVFSAGFFTFKPQLCNEKDLVGKDLPPSLPIGGGGMLPPLPVPDVPIPPVVPSVPNPPGVPLPPDTRQKPSESNKSNKLSDQKTFGFPFPPNPFQPPTLPPLPLVPSPPSIFPPLPFQPSPPSIFPPLPYQPSPPSLFPPIFPAPPPPSLFPPLQPFPPLPFPPVPSLIPSPPPPPPPAFPIPLPPFPPIPGIPPVPPASTSPRLEKTTP